MAHEPRHPADRVAVHAAHRPRPRALILLLMPFVPESRVWAARKRAGTLQRPSLGELFSPSLRKTTIVTTLLSACGYAAAFGANMPLNLPPNQPPVGVSVASEGTAIRVDTFVPTQLVKSVTAAVIQLQMQMQGGGMGGGM